MKSRLIYIPLWQLIWQARNIWKWILILCSSSPSSSAACGVLCPCSLRWCPNLVWFAGFIEVLGHLKACLTSSTRLGDQLNQMKLFFVSTICDTYHHQLSNPRRPRFKQCTMLFWPSFICLMRWHTIWVIAGDWRALCVNNLACVWVCIKQISVSGASWMLMLEKVRLSADLSSSHPLRKKSTEQMKKIPTIVLSVSYKGVKFIDATNKVIVRHYLYYVSIYT